MIISDPKLIRFVWEKLLNTSVGSALVFSILGQCRSGSRSRVLMPKNWKKLTAENNYFFKIYLTLSLHKERPCYRKRREPQKRTSSTSNHEISSLFPILVVNCMIFAILDTDPADQNQCGSGPETLLLNSIADPNPAPFRPLDPGGVKNQDPD